MRIWTPGVAPVVRDKKKGKNIQCKEDILEVPGGGEIHSTILSAFAELGRDRTEEHFVKYFINIIDNDEDVTKSDRVNLTKIDFTVESLKLKLAQEIIMQTSTSAKDFEDRFFTKQMLIDNIKHMTLSVQSRERVSQHQQTNTNDQK